MKIIISALLILLFFSNSLLSKDWVYFVVPGDNIWAISERFLTKTEHYEAVQRMNNIQFPRRMQPGTVLRIPLDWVAQQASKVKVSFIKGSALKVSKGQQTVTNQSTEFGLGDELRLDRNSTISLLFADGTKININSETIIKFDHLSQYGSTGMVDTRLRLQSGKAEVQAAKQIGSGSRLDIQAASAITSVRGTVFRVGSKLDENNKEVAIVEVIEGKVNVEADGKDVDIPAGFGLALTEGETLSEPKELLSAPQLFIKEKMITTRDYIINWTEVDKATLYNVLISETKDFSQLLWQTTTNETQMIWPKIGDGKFYLRVTGISAEGVEGLPTENKLLVNIEPIAPVLNHKSVVLKDGADTITWQPSHFSDLYKLQLSQVENFSSLLFDSSVTQTSFIPLTSWEVGKIYWRVAVSDNQGGWGPFSQVNSFILRSPIERISLKANPLGGEVHIKWSALPKGQTAELQSSNSADFKNPSTFNVSDNNETTVPVTNERQMYIRARIKLDMTGELGSWSKVCRINDSKNFAICNI